MNIPAYHETLPIPTKPLPPDFDHAGTLAIFFTIERCYSHALDDPACTEINAGLSQLLKNWTQNPDCPFRGEVFIGEYYNVSSFASLALPFARTRAVDIPFYHFLYRLIRVRLLENQGDAARAGLEARSLRDVGEALRREDLVMRHQQGDAPHDCYRNGLTATWFSQTYVEVMADYGLDTPDTPGGKPAEEIGTDTHLP